MANHSAFTPAAILRHATRYSSSGWRPLSKGRNVDWPYSMPQPPLAQPHKRVRNAGGRLTAKGTAGAAVTHHGPDFAAGKPFRA